MKPRYLWVILFYFTFVYSFHSCLKTIHKLYPNEVSEELWFEQRLDHFNNQNQVYWKQRYYVNDTFYNPNLGGPIFVEIGGEGDLSPFYVTRSQLVHYGQKFGALMVAVEHRFYGKSQPFPDLSVPHLAYLSSQQALADAAYFITEFKKMHKAENADVVTFGCSYPGNLAAWFRMKYPHVTIGSVASSAPVLAVLDFYQYLDVVDHSLTYYVGVECDNLIRKATNEIQTLLQSPDGTTKVEKYFNTCDPIKNIMDVRTFMSNLIGDFQEAVQYNDELGPNISIKTLCGIMINGSKDPVVAYAKVSNLFNPKCMPVSYDQQVQQIRDTTTFSVGGVGLRQWVYQTCNEFGYFQTTDSDNQPFGNLVPIKYFTEQCIDIFDVDLNPDLLVNYTNMYYGGNKLTPTSGTNILFVNGNIDPWHALGVTQDVSSTLTTILIDGTAHCRNVLPVDDKSPPDLIEAIKKTEKTISEWLQHHV